MHTNLISMLIERIYQYQFSINNFNLKDAAKGNIKPKEDWRAVDSPKIRTEDFFLLYTANNLRHANLLFEINFNSY